MYQSRCTHPKNNPSSAPLTAWLLPVSCLDQRDGVNREMPENAEAPTSMRASYKDGRSTCSTTTSTGETCISMPGPGRVIGPGVLVHGPRSRRGIAPCKSWDGREAREAPTERTATEKGTGNLDVPTLYVLLMGGMTQLAPRMDTITRGAVYILMSNSTCTYGVHACPFTMQYKTRCPWVPWVLT